MPKMRFEYPGSVPAGDRLPEGLISSGLEFLEKLFTPDELPTIADEHYKEWKYGPTAAESGEYRHEGQTGVRGLMAYRAQFTHPELGHAKLLGYDVVGVPLSRSFDIPESTGRQVGGFFFRSYFNLPPTPELPEGLPEVSLLMDEHLVFGDDGKVVGRMYRPYDENGVAGRHSPRPGVNQHVLVGRQVEYFAATGGQLPLPTAREAFSSAYPGVDFGSSPTPSPFLEDLSQR